ncbi:MAG TPA: tRNA (guanosine(46)-N7)-methyltransferase TrmB [Savagea sp.]
MRLRHKPWAKDYLKEQHVHVVTDPENVRGSWHTRFAKKQPLHIEVGTGKGRFIVGMAKQNPHINYIGIEHFDDVIVSAVEMAVEENLPNLQLIRGNGEHLTDMFERGEVDRVYLNFSDPWPKKRHAKRRLTNRRFLERYEQILRKNGEIHFKTDNRGLFEYSLVEMSQYGLVYEDISLDLHAAMPEDNIMTEYEEKFSKKGYPIYRMEARFVHE